MKKIFLILLFAFLPLSAFAQLSYENSDTRHYPEYFSGFTSTGIYLDTITPRFAEKNNADCWNFGWYWWGAFYYPISSCVVWEGGMIITYSFFNEFDILDSNIWSINNTMYMANNGAFNWYESGSKLMFDIISPSGSIIQHNYKTLPIGTGTNSGRFLLAWSFSLLYQLQDSDTKIKLSLIRTSTDIYSLSGTVFSFKSDFLGTGSTWYFLNIQNFDWASPYPIDCTSNCPSIQYQGGPASIYDFRYVVDSSLFPIGITVFDQFREVELANWTSSTMNYVGDFYDPLPPSYTGALSDSFYSRCNYLDIGCYIAGFWNYLYSFISPLITPILQILALPFTLYDSLRSSIANDWCTDPGTLSGIDVMNRFVLSIGAVFRLANPFIPFEGSYMCHYDYGQTVKTYLVHYPHTTNNIIDYFIIVVALLWFFYSSSRSMAGVLSRGYGAYSNYNLNRALSWKIFKWIKTTYKNEHGKIISVKNHHSYSRGQITKNQQSLPINK